MRIILVMAGLPATRNQSSKELTRPQEIVLGLLADGHKHTAIATKLAKGDPKKAKVWRATIRRWMYSDALFQQGVANAARAEAGLSLVPVTKAVVKRAERGRIDAAKLLYESSGYHNPRVQHEHSGDIKISLDMPRPERKELDGPGKEDGEQIVDAEVVED